MRELETEYADQANFVIVSPEDTAAAGEEIKSLGFEEARHGLAIFDSEGKAVGKLPGHNYGREDIEALLKTVL